MITLNIDAQLIRAAMANQAKKDVRYYLNGILLTTKGDIVGTDGHSLFQAKHNWENCDVIPRDLILQIDGTIPVTAKTVTIELDDFTEIECDIPRGLVKTDNGKVFTCSGIDGKYPDFNRVIPNRLSDSYSNTLTFNGSLLARIEKTFGKDKFVNIYTRGEANPIRIECTDSPDSVLVIMPMRAKTPVTDSFELFTNPNIDIKAA